VAKAKPMARIIITCHAGEERRDLTCSTGRQLGGKDG